MLKEAVTLIVDEIAKSNIYTMRVFYGQDGKKYIGFVNYNTRLAIYDAETH